MVMLMMIIVIISSISIVIIIRINNSKMMTIRCRRVNIRVEIRSDRIRVNIISVAFFDN